MRLNSRLSVIVLSVVLSSCLALSAYAEPQDTPFPQPANLHIRLGPPASKVRFTSAMQIISAKCLACHKLGGSAADFTRYISSEAKWVEANYVVAGSAESSILFKYLKGSGFSPSPLGTMPIGNTLLTSELEILRAWINQMSKEPQPTPMPSPTGSQPPSSGLPLLPSQNFPRLGGRAFVKSVLDDIFGPTAQTITNTLVLPSVSTFGGACDPMGQPPPANQGGGDVCTGVDVSNVSAPFVPVTSTPRAGLTMKVCNVLVFNDAPLQYAIKNATQKTDLTYLSTNSMPSNADIVAAYSLFLPTRAAPPQSVVDALIAVAQSVQSPTCPAQRPNCRFDPWRYLLLTICYQPDWQVL